jgi:AcrR family transcriptional regulator
MADGTTLPASTARFARKREAIIAAATVILNRQGVKGATLADVAASVGLITTSVTYYFKKKEDLAAACFLSSIDRIDALIAQALLEPTPPERLLKILDLYLDLDRRIRLEEEPAIAILSDVRALSEEHLAPIWLAITELYRKLADLFEGPGGQALDRRDALARAHVLLEQIFWSRAWLPRYDVEDYPRIRDRMFDILAHGLAAPGAEWNPVLLDPILVNGGQTDAPTTPQETFLLAATRLINQQGYRGASVEKISALLNVTKGSFYHHNDAKDDLVVACFEHSFEVVRRVQSAGQKLPGTFWMKLSSVARTLAEHQLSDRGPLLRSSALSALPEAIREQMVEQSSRLSGRFAAMISDGVADGSIRAVDPMIAAQMLNATLNAAADLRADQTKVTQAEVGAFYAKPMLMGILAG